MVSILLWGWPPALILSDFEVEQILNSGATI